MYQFIKITRSRAATTLWLNHPPLNILTIAMIEETIGALVEIREDAKTRLLILRGSGECFSAGMDVADHLPNRMQDMLEKTHRMMLTLAQIDVPTISLIHGAALGGGLELATIADFVYAVEGCKIALPEIQLGVFPPLATAYFPELMGVRNANEFILTGRTIFPEEAKQLGLINAVFAKENVETELKEITERLMNLSKAALASTKKALHRASLFRRLKDIEEIYLNELMTTSDATEGLKAFLEKRKPSWKHR